MLRWQAAWIAAIVAVAVFAGCQRTVRLMPAPVAFASGEHSPFPANSPVEKSNLVEVFYATNRLPLGPRGSRLYTIVPDQSLYLGRAVVRIGAGDKSWEELHALSTTDSNSRRPALSLDSLDELATLRDNDSSMALTAEAHGFFEAINQALAQSLDKDLTVYVHGANSSMKIAAAQAAQYRHFTGRHSVVLMFAWPSAERGMRYFTDVRNARASVPAFARLLDFLARQTTAKHINIVAYSAGSQVLSPALVELRRLRRSDSLADVRLGELYFAAPDIAFPTFVRQLPRYIDFVRRVTVSVNLNDAALALSSWVHGVSRLGRPDSTELSDADSDWLVKAAEKLDFDVISVEPAVIPGLGRRSHAFWYEHPWVSSDVMIKLLFHIPPTARGLDRNRYRDRFPFWTFPPDYDRRVVDVLRELRSGRPTPKSEKAGGGTGPGTNPRPAE
ncbi:alpha/beta hydrolase [Methylomagnum sp.]